jgi:hypothetical protein
MASKKRRATTDAVEISAGATTPAGEHATPGDSMRTVIDRGRNGPGLGVTATIRRLARRRACVFPGAAQRLGRLK